MMMISSKSILPLLALLALAFVFTEAFQQQQQQQLSSRQSSTTKVSSTTSLYAYVPSGFTKESYAKFQQEEAKKKSAQKNLGGVGPRGFKSRSFQSFQEALEKGEADHLMPVFNAKEKVRQGKLKAEDIPYMQRGGNWDNSDVKGAKKIGWLKSDKSYSKGGFKKEQSVSILGTGEGLDWTGKRARSRPLPTTYVNGIGGGNKKTPPPPKKKNNFAKKGKDDDDKQKKKFGWF
jgi:hypothetical protein